MTTRFRVGNLDGLYGSGSLYGFAAGPVMIRLASGPHRPGICRGCRREIFWAKTLNGKSMPMNEGALPRHQDEGVDVYDAADSHWASCPDRVQFDRKARSSR